MIKRFAAALLLVLVLASPAAADSPVVGEIRIWAGVTSPPAGWVLISGSSMSGGTTYWRYDYPELYAAIGCTYGCTGDYMFLPNLAGRVVVGQDSGQSEFNTLGETGGEKTHTLTVNEMPEHNHIIRTSVDKYLAAGTTYGFPGFDSNGMEKTFYTEDEGGNAAHNTLQPYAVMNYIMYIGGASAPPPTSTPTPRPTYTPAATYTPAPTYTPQPTYTPTPQPTAVPTQAPQQPTEPPPEPTAPPPTPTVVVQANDTVPKTGSGLLGVALAAGLVVLLFGVRKARTSTQ